MGESALATDPNRLADLLDYLRQQAGYKITPHEYAVAQDLITAVIARGDDLSNEAVARYLAPVLCASPREQADYPEHFKRWSTQIKSLPSRAPSHPDVAGKQVIAAAGRWKFWRWILLAIAAAIAVGIGLLWWQRFHAPHSPAPAPADSGLFSIGDIHAPIIVGASIAVGLLLTLAAWAVWWYLRADLFLKRRTTNQEPDLVSVSLERGATDFLDYALLKRAARELRRRFRVPSSDLAIDPTIEQTVRNSGQFAPVFCSRLLAPEYLVLIDRATFNDHSAAYLDELFDRMEADQVRVRRYYFDHDPRSLSPHSKHESPLTLRDLSANSADARVLIFTDAAGFFNPVSGEIDSWTGALWQWPYLAFFTPKPRQTWSYQEHLLSERVPVLPAGIDSIIAFAQYMHGVRLPRLDDEDGSGPFPVQLAERPSRWMERDSPQPELVSEVLGSVLLFLGDEAYLWLSACAVYPELHFNLTVYLGANLKDAQGNPLLTTRRLTALFRLPWFKAGYMPDWLRLYLVSGLSQEDLAFVRGVLNRLWLSAASGSDKAINLEIAHKHQGALTELARSVFRKMARRSTAVSPLRDHVFASVMLGRSLERLGVRIPGAWRRILKYRRELAIASLSPAKRRLSQGISIAVLILALVYLLGPFTLRRELVLCVTVLSIQVLLILLALILGLIWFERRLLLLGVLSIQTFWLGFTAGIIAAGDKRGTEQDMVIFSSLELIWLILTAIISFRVSPRVGQKDPQAWGRPVRLLFWWTTVVSSAGSFVPSFGPILIVICCIFLCPIEAIKGVRVGSRCVILHSLFPQFMIVLIWLFGVASLVPDLTVVVLFLGASLWIRARLRKGITQATADSRPSQVATAA
ncbi:MAG TPA: hypothetical protein VMF91_03465 [Bryobacteraceae bacterium]|nr:hypothetical protein [Bryobacteraceae bacterium]